jgi:hypothetical protein
MDEALSSQLIRTPTLNFQSPIPSQPSQSQDEDELDITLQIFTTSVYQTLCLD